MTRFVLAAALVLALGAASLASAAPASAAPLVGVTVGIADQKADMFGDERFAELGLRRARLYVPWDVMSRPEHLAETEAWLDAARRQGVKPLVSFGHSRARRRSLPSPRRFRSAVRAFRKRFPFVRDYATWNEANHCGEPVCNRPELVARYWRELRRECRGCKVLAAEVLDQPNAVRYIRRFERAAKMRPRYWGVHNYVEANRFKTRRLRQILRATKADIWLTEVAGIVRRKVRRRETVKRIPESTRHAARVLRFLFDRVLPSNRRIKRLYVYHWNASTPQDTWDSGLIGSRGDARAAFRVLENRLGRRASRRR